MTAVPTTLRETGPADLEAIPRVQREAFGRDTEAALTEALLADATTRPALSLLALRGAEAAGHILFTRCRIEEAETAQGSRYPPAPLAVVPCCQRQGIGALSHPAAACRMVRVLSNTRPSRTEGRVLCADTLNRPEYRNE